MIVTKKTQRKRPQQQVVTTTVERPFKQPRPSFARQIGAVASSTAPEKKNFDLAGTLTGAGAGQWSPVTLINGIAQGNTANTRIGRRLTLTSMTVRWTTTGAFSGTGRWMIIYDHAPNGALPLITDILTVDTVNGFMNLINNDRFMVIHDEYINNFNTAGAATMCGKWNYNRQPLQNQWTNAATGTIADITTGAVYILACSPNVITGVVFGSRIRFTDM